MKLSTLVLLMLFLLSVRPLQAQEKPNFLFIFSDDQRFDMVQALGNADLNTPNLDRLVQQGTTFTHAYNMGAWNGAVCVASRAMIISGLSVWDAREAEPEFDTFTQKKRFWPQILEQEGYDTYMSGKWHIKANPEELFHHVAHVRPGMPNQTPEGYDRPKTRNDTVWQPWDPKFEGFWKGGKHWSEVLADDGVAFIQQAKEKNNPFFMYLAFNAPHDPRQSPKSYVDQYPVDEIKIPRNYLELYPYKDSIGLGPDLRDEALAPFPRTPYSVQKNIQEYYAIITHMDDQIGRILDALEHSGKRENTYIIFTSDHGLAVGHHGLMGKQNMYDHSLRVPLVIVGPNIPKNKKLSQQVYLQDVMATTIDLAGAKKDKDIAFHSLMPYILDHSQSIYPAIYGCYLDLQRMIRTEDHKLVVYPKAEKVLLFDLKMDPSEMEDLSDDPAYREIKTHLIQELIKLQHQYNDPLDVSALLVKQI